MFDRKKQSLIFGLLLFFVGVVTFLYWGNQKQVWFCDEIYTYESANGFEQEWPATKVDVWQTGKDVEAFFSADWDRFSLKDISDRLYCDHVPLYFWIFRVISVILFQGSGSIWIGLSINLVFYLAFLGVVYALFLKVTDSPVTALIITMLACVFNRLLLEQATTIRMYMMLVFLELLLLVTQVSLLKQVGMKKWPWKNLLATFFVTVAGFLTHYDFWIFYAACASVFCVALLLWAFRAKGKRFIATEEFRYVIYAVGNFVISLLVTIGIFPYCRWNLNRGKGETALQSVLVFNYQKWQHIQWGYKRLSECLLGERLPVGIGLVLLFGILIGGAVALHKKGSKFHLTTYILSILVSQCYQLIVCFTLPDVEEERYLWGSYTIMALCIAWGAVFIFHQLFLLIKEEKKRKPVQWLAAAILFVAILAGELMVIDGGAGVMYLKYPGAEKQLLEKEREIPWIVYGPTVGVYSYYDWLIPDQICFLTKENTNEDAEAIKQMGDTSNILLYVYQDYIEDALGFLEQQTGKTYVQQYIFDSVNLSVYKLTATQ